MVSVQSQFTVPEDWTICNLPYESQDLYIFKMSDAEYEASSLTLETKTKFTGLSQTVGFSAEEVEVVGKVAITGVPEFKQHSMIPYTNKTVWLTWDDNSPAVQIAADLREQNPVDHEFVLACMG